MENVDDVPPARRRLNYHYADQDACSVAASEQAGASSASLQPQQHVQQQAHHHHQEQEQEQEQGQDGEQGQDQGQGQDDEHGDVFASSMHLLQITNTTGDIDMPLLQTQDSLGVLLPVQHASANNRPTDSRGNILFVRVRTPRQVGFDAASSPCSWPIMATAADSGMAIMPSSSGSNSGGGACDEEMDITTDIAFD